MNIILLSRYSTLGASSRMRSYQYLPYLENAGIHVTVANLFDNTYITKLYNKNISYKDIVILYLKRLKTLFKIKKFDVIWIEKEIFPWLPCWIELNMLPSGIPVVVDYDDALFHRYDQHRISFIRKFMGKKIDYVMRRANVVLVGNAYLGNRAYQAGARKVELIPTVIDIRKYNLTDKNTCNDNKLVIGWIGSPGTARYLQLIAPALIKIAENPNVEIHAIGAKQEQLNGLPIKAIPWLEETEVDNIRKFDIGIMPIPDEPFEHGKCGYKLIQYMACEKPVIASPIGINNTLVKEGKNGFLTSNTEEWLKALTLLINDQSLRERLGKQGRSEVEDHFCIQKTAPKLINIFNEIL